MPLKIFTVSHKVYTFPSHNAYTPLQVGTSQESIAEKSVRDSTGDNIAHLNPSFCELTAAYWIWKNVQEEVVGLAHYRRYFASSTSNLTVKGKRIASPEEMADMLKSADILVAKPRNYFITSIKSHYIHAHHESDYTQLRDEIALQQPDYVADFDHVMGGTKISLYNMFVCKKSLIDEYFAWLFPLCSRWNKK